LAASALPDCDLDIFRIVLRNPFFAPTELRMAGHIFKCHAHH